MQKYILKYKNLNNEVEVLFEIIFFMIMNVETYTIIIPEYHFRQENISETL